MHSIKAVAKSEFIDDKIMSILPKKRNHKKEQNPHSMTIIPKSTQNTRKGVFKKHIFAFFIEKIFCHSRIA